MEIQLNGYKVEIERMYTYKVYAGLLCGRIDSERNNYEEEQAKKELDNFSYRADANLYFSPHRHKISISSHHQDIQEMIKEDYLERRYHADNFPEEHLATYWIFLELVSYDKQFIEDKEGFCTSLNIACNISSIDTASIEKYLYKNLTSEIWKNQSIDFTP